MATHETPLAEFVAVLREQEPSLERLTDRKVRMLAKTYAFETVGDLYGTLHPLAPPAAGSSVRCTIPSFHKEAKWVSVEARTRQFARALGLPRAPVKELVAHVERVSRPLMRPVRVRSAWHLGGHRSGQRLRSARDYHVVDVHDLPEHGVPPRQQSPLYLPQLLGRLGPAWDQGKRGTCVAHAAGAQFTYLTGKPVSRQFLYHQCKMIDGIAHREGTFCEAAMKVFSDRSLSGRELDWGEADSGVVTESCWPYVPSKIEDNKAHTPPPKHLRKRLYHGKRWGNTRGEVIRCSNRTQRLVDDIRTLIFHVRVPVTVALPIYVSFHNLNSSRTGQITMPLPEEKLVGWHAMLVVGFDDARDMFIVRNSWGVGWAAECGYLLPDGYRMAGHAIIPYRYFAKYSEPCYAVRFAEAIRANVREERRLYNSPRDALGPAIHGRKRAATSQRGSHGGAGTKRSSKKRRTRTSKDKTGLFGVIQRTLGAKCRPGR